MSSLFTPLQDKEGQVQGSFDALFKEGYYVKNLFDHLRQTNVEGNFVFTEAGVDYRCQGHDNWLMNEITLRPDGDNFIYKYNSSSPKIVVGINTVDLRTITKSINKKDKLRLYKKEGEEILHDQILIRSKDKKDKDHANEASIIFKNITEDSTESPDVDSTMLCVSTTASIFSKTCANMGQAKTEYVELTIHPAGFVIESCGNNIVKKREEYGVVEEGNGEGLPRLKIPSYVIKTLCKLNNISNSNILRVYLHPERPIVIESDIATGYGRLRTFINNKEEE